MKNQLNDSEIVMVEPNEVTISPVRPEKVSMDFDQLREEGIAYIQGIAGKIWTDYNVHDPGVTILEQLCYAITDLANRANLDIADLLAKNPSDKSSENELNFFTAREILTNAPLTIEDYRALLIDIKGVKNAWLEKKTESEVDFFADKQNKEITYTENAHTEKIELNGLYNILIELDAVDPFGDLNDNTVTKWLEIEEGPLAGLQLEITIEFPYWSDELPSGKSWKQEADVRELAKNSTVLVKNRITDHVVKIETNASLEVDVEVAFFNGITYVDAPGLATDLKNKIEACIGPGSEPGNLIKLQQEKIAATFAIINEVRNVMHANRNLCEDFIKIGAPKIEEIVLCADIEITTESDAEEVLAEIYFQIAQFLAPEIRFYAFADLLKKGKKTEEIFEGPRLNSGFVDRNELRESERRKNIRVSDLINIIMDVEGVVAVKEIKIGNIPLGDSSILSQTVLWCLKLAWEKNFVPRLSPEKSKVTLFKKGIPFLPNADEVRHLLDEKEENNRQKNGLITELDLPVPEGDFYDLNAYETIQTGFPQNYGIGNVGLPAGASPERKAQAHQLKGFLQFFDQLLANYCMQLGHIKSLFSMREDVDKTYFNQPLYDTPNGAQLFTDFITHAGLSSNPKNDNKSALKAAWKTFQEDENNAYRTRLNEITESETTFLRRRNAFLDHLLARFCEQFADYAMLAYKLDGKKAGEELIADKLRFLTEYPEISYGRGRAFNYKLPGWNTENVSGFEKRVARLLGIDQYERRDLACPPPLDLFEKFKDEEGKWRFRITDFEGDILLKSEAYNSSGARTTGMKSVVKNGVDIENYKLEKAENGQFYYNLIAQNGEIIGTSNLFPSEMERNEALQQLISMLSGDCNGEGFYLIEHLLLRPRVKPNDHFLPVSFKKECYCPGNEDAYSFRATCIFPYWIGRFTNMDFRNFVEQTLREEAPAHVFLKICWINPEQMKAFQKAYREWLESLEKSPLNTTELTAKQNALIALLDKVRNVYPVSHLFDCQETENNPVRLNQSILGTFTPKENE